MKSCWAGVVRCWAMAPLIGWLPGTAPRPAQWFWWSVLSSVVLIVGLTQPVRRQPPSVLSMGLGVLVLSCLLHWEDGLVNVLWYGQSVLLGMAVAFVIERADPHWVRDGVLMGAAIAGIWCGWQALQGARIVGLGGKEAGIGLVFAVASVWSTGWAAWGWAGLALLTLSWAAWPIPVLRLGWAWLKQLGLIGLLSALSLLLLTWPWWNVKLLSRLEVWNALPSFRPFWLTGWGSGLFPFGFQEVDPSGTMVGARDFHNTWMDWGVRLGVLGVAVMLAGALWLWRHRGRLGPSGCWTFWLLVWFSLWQSMESLPPAAGVLLMAVSVWGSREG